MKNWLKWKLLWCIVFLVVCYVCFKRWCKESLLHHIAYYFRIYVVIDFILTCYSLPNRYNEKYMYNFYYHCIYIVFLIVLFIMVNKFLKALEEDKNGNTTS